MDRAETIDTKTYLSRIGVWPAIPAAANPERWLLNFQEEEEEHAVALLDAFVFIPAKQVQKIFHTTIHALSAEVTLSEQSYEEKRAAWSNFLDAAVVTHPTGEVPNPSDSGYIFQRLMRQDLGFDEDQLVEPAQALNELESNPHRPVLFVDDFAGSGSQFLETWRRSYEATGVQISFSELDGRVGGLDSYYTPALCTSYARARLLSEAPNVKLRPAHLLTEEYGINSTDTLLFPKYLRPTARDFVIAASSRAGLSGDMVLGFHDLGLAVGFEHSMPDATMQMIWHDGGDVWQPLVRRS